MRKIAKLCSALLLAWLVQPGLNVSPSKLSSEDEAPSLEMEDTESKDLHSSSHLHPHNIIPHEVHIHDYNHNALQNKPPKTHGTSLHNLKDSFVGVLKYVDDFFHFVKIVNKDDVLATDVVDGSWEEWLKHFHKIVPVISKYTVSASDIESPHEDAQETLTDKLLYKLLRGAFITKVKKSEEKESESEDDVSDTKYTSIRFDPINNFVNGILNTLRFYSGYESIQEWFKSIREEFKNYSAFSEQILSGDELEPDVADAVAEGGGLLSFPLPPGILRLAKYEPWNLGISAAFFIVFHAFLWGFYIPAASYASFFGDDPVRTADYDYLDDEGEEDYDDIGDDIANDGNGVEPPEAGLTNRDDLQGEGFPDEDTIRLDSYAYYSHYYNRYKQNSHSTSQPKKYNWLGHYPRNANNYQQLRSLRYQGFL